MRDWAFRNNIKAEHKNCGGQYAGHFITDLIDNIVKLEETMCCVRNGLTYKNWSATTSTLLPEAHIGVALVSRKVRRDRRIEDIAANARLMKLAAFQTPQKKHLASTFKTDLPVTPAHTVEKLKLFEICMRKVGLTDIPRVTELLHSAVLKNSSMMPRGSPVEGLELEMNSNQFQLRGEPHLLRVAEARRFV